MNLRVWDEESQEMADIIGYKLEKGDRIIVLTKCEGGERLQEYRTKDLMRGSEVLDINKKEIFEGDYLEDFEYPVYFKDGCFFVMIQYDKHEFPLYELENLTVVGNVFDNPNPEFYQSWNNEGCFNEEKMKELIRIAQEEPATALPMGLTCEEFIRWCRDPEGFKRDKDVKED